MDCASCHSDLPPGCVFCPQCGAPQAPPCEGCGQINSPSAAFCGRCGQALGGAQPQVAERRRLGQLLDRYFGSRFAFAIFDLLATTDFPSLMTVLRLGIEYRLLISRPLRWIRLALRL